jgi:hypothetical protein
MGKIMYFDNGRLVVNIWKEIMSYNQNKRMERG